MPIAGEVITWCEPSDRIHLKLVAGDIKHAVSWFKDTTGQDAKLIVLNPKNERYISEVPDGIEVEYVGGCLAWEVWFSVDVNSTEIPNENLGGEKAITIPDVPPTILSTSNGKKIRVDKINPSVGKVTHENRGRKIIDLPDDLIRRWAGEGIGAKGIATRLNRECQIVTSYKTIQRRIQGILM